MEPLNEYVRRLLETGIIGTIVFLAPFIHVLYKILIIIKKSTTRNKAVPIMIFSALFGSCVSAINIWINVYASLWILLGLGLVFLKGIERRKHENML